MRIIHLYYDLAIGGIQTLLVSLANHQAAEGHEVTILILNKEVDAHNVARLNPKVRLVSMGKPRRSKNPYYVGKLNMYLMTHPFDMLHTHNAKLKRMIVPIGQKHRCNTLHAMCRGKVNSDELWRYENRFAISEAVRQDVKKQYGLDCITVENGIEVADFDHTGKKLGETDGKFHIVQVGRLDHRVKGQDILIEAVAQCKASGINVAADIIGEGASKDYLDRQIKVMGCEADVRLLGAKAADYLKAHLCEYDLLVQPSRYEGFGLTVAEAMAARVPALVSDNEGPMEVIGQGMCGYSFATGSAEDCARKIAWIVAHKDETAERVEKAYRRAVERYDVANTARQYLAHYERILNQ